jgi:hypothetical protein
MRKRVPTDVVTAKACANHPRHRAAEVLDRSVRHVGLGNRVCSERAARTTITTPVEVDKPAVERPLLVAVTWVAERLQPMVESLGAVAATPAQAAEVLAQAAEVLAPAVEQLAPAAESLAQAAESPVPAAESLAPAAESLAPVAESLAPAVESLVPAVESLAPAAE